MVLNDLGLAIGDRHTYQLRYFPLKVGSKRPSNVQNVGTNISDELSGEYSKRTKMIAISHTKCMRNPIHKKAVKQAVHGNKTLHRNNRVCESERLNKYTNMGTNKLKRQHTDEEQASD